MSIERDLISKILHERDLVTVTEGGVTPNYFQDYENRRAYEHILEHQRKFSSVPTVEAFKRDFDPTYRVTNPEDTLPYFVSKATEYYTTFLLEAGLSEAVDLFEDGDTDEAKFKLAETLSLLNREITSSRVTDLTKTRNERLARYAEYAKSKGVLKGISSGFASIDNATNGFQRKQLITIAGPPKAGKSTIVLLADMAAHQNFYTPLFIGFEMSNEEQEERHDAIRAKISHKALRNGHLSKDDRESLEKMMRRMDNMPPMIFSEDADSTLTLSGVAAQIEKHNPDIVFVDGVYMMEDEQGERKGTPQALTNITRGFKQMAKNLDICIVITTQVLEWKMDRKRGVTSNSIGYSSSFIQDSDCVIAVERTDEPNVNKVKIVLARNNAGMETLIKWDWETGDFEELESYEEDDEEAESKF